MASKGGIKQLCSSMTEKDLPNYLNGKFKAQRKVDGERIMAIKQDGTITLMNRRGRIKNTFYAEVVEELLTIDGDFIIDGEMALWTGEDNFTHFQRRALTSKAEKQEAVREEIPVSYYVFDIIKVGGEFIHNKPLKERFSHLENNSVINFTQTKHIHLIPFHDNIEEMNEKSKALGWEGLVIKNMDSPYEFKRTDNWKKLKNFQEEVWALVQYTDNNAGIRCVNTEGKPVQVSGAQSTSVKNKLDSGEVVEAEIQFLSKNEDNGNYRMATFKREVGAE